MNHERDISDHHHCGASRSGNKLLVTQHGHEHIILEQAAQAGERLAQRSLGFVHACHAQLGHADARLEPPGANPHGFMPRDELVAFFEQYIERFGLPVHYNTQVTSIERHRPVMT